MNHNDRKILATNLMKTNLTDAEIADIFFALGCNRTRSLEEIKKLRAESEPKIHYVPRELYKELSDLKRKVQLYDIFRKEPSLLNKSIKKLKFDIENYESIIKIIEEYHV